jgi:hypothetical protein
MALDIKPRKASPRVPLLGERKDTPSSIKRTLAPLPTHGGAFFRITKMPPLRRNIHPAAGDWERAHGHHTQPNHTQSTRPRQRQFGRRCPVGQAGSLRRPCPGVREAAHRGRMRAEREFTPARRALAPTDGSPRVDDRGAIVRIVRGGAWSVSPQVLRSAARLAVTAGNRVNFIGFRLARTSNP